MMMRMKQALREVTERGFQIAEPVLWSLLVLDVFDIQILDFVQVELGFLYHYA